MFLLFVFSLKIVNRNVYGLDHIGATLNFQGQPGLLTEPGLQKALSVAVLHKGHLTPPWAWSASTRVVSEARRSGGGTDRGGGAGVGCSART